MCMKTPEKEMKANALYYKHTRIRENVRVDVKIRLSDDCKNGHNDFAVTGTIYERQRNGRWEMIGGGCCHDEILSFFPEFRPFVDLHLCDAKGAPMYPEANGFYFLERKNKQEVVKSYLRITEPEYEHIRATASDELCLKYLLYDMGVVARWEQEAKAAIKQLEEMTGKTFVDNSRRYQLSPLTTEETELIERRIVEGYYLPEAIENRRRDAVKKKIDNLRDGATKEIKKIETALTVKTQVLEAGMSLNDFIYYDHTNIGVFNWRTCYMPDERVTPEEFDVFLTRVDYSRLPEGIKFQLGE